VTRHHPRWLPDPNIRKWALTPCKADLTACDSAGDPTWPTQNGKFIVGQYKVPEGDTLIIRAIVPYAVARTYVTQDTEAFTLISAANALDQFGFEPIITGPTNTFFKAQMPGLNEYAAADNQSQTDVKQAGAIYGISDTPYDTALRVADSDVFNIVVGGNETFSLLFSLIPQGRGPVTAAGDTKGLTEPIPGRYSIGGSVANSRRVDWVGAYVWGDLVPTSHYEKMKAEFFGGR
jgi:hypothetical protein